MLRWNSVCGCWEFGHWYTGRYGRTLWKSEQLAPSTFSPWPAPWNWFRNK